MAFTATVIRILLASPMDVEEERENIHAFINEWNVTHTLSEKVVLWPVNWDSLVAQDTTGDLSDENSSRIIDDCDILIGIFWTHTDQKAGAKKSLLIDKMEKFIKTGKPSLLYFSTQPISPDKINPDQYAILRGFKEMAQKHDTVFQYRSSDELMEMVSTHLLAKIRDIHGETQPEKTERKFESATVGRQEKAGDAFRDEKLSGREDTSDLEDMVKSHEAGTAHGDVVFIHEPPPADEAAADIPLADVESHLTDDVVNNIELDERENNKDRVPAKDSSPGHRTASVEKKAGRQVDAEMEKIKKKYISELSHLEVEWIVERDSEPDGIKDGKSILDQVRQKLMDFQIAIQRRIDEENIHRLSELIISAKDTQNHQLLADGGKSYDAFWKKGNEIFLKFKEFTDSL